MSSYYCDIAFSSLITRANTTGQIYACGYSWAEFEVGVLGDGQAHVVEGDEVYFTFYDVAGDQSAIKSFDSAQLIFYKAKAPFVGFSSLERIQIGEFTDFKGLTGSSACNVIGKAWRALAPTTLPPPLPYFTVADVPNGNLYTFSIAFKVTMAGNGGEQFEFRLDPQMIVGEGEGEGEVQEKVHRAAADGLMR